MADSMMFIPDMVEEDEGGIVAKHPNRFVLPLVVAPAPEDKPDSFNTLRHSFFTVACKDVPDNHFDFDRSFVRPEAKDAFRKLRKTILRHPDCPLAIWGHTDPEGTFEYNQFLSERRAEAVFGILVRDLDTWERLSSSASARGAAVGDVWGDESIEVCLEELGFPTDKDNNEKLQSVIKRFEAARGDPNPPGRNDAPFRRKLFAEYMDSICVDDKGAAYKLERKDFLGEGGEHGPFQGCSKFNPQLVLAKSESDEFAKDKKDGKDNRHAANRDNRRVMIFLFAEGTKIDPDPKKWPCPRAKDKNGLDKCKAHQFSDAKERREKVFPDRRRRFGKQVRNETDRFSHPEMTFGCRFYHALAQRSPCERDLQMFAIQLLIDAPKRTGVDGAEKLVPVPNVRFVAVIGEAAQSAVVRGRTTENGMIGIPFLSPLSSMLLKVDIAGAITGDIPPEIPEDPSDDRRADTDRFEDEDTFIAYQLRPDRLFRLVTHDPVPPPLEPDAGEPAVSDEEKQLGARQRLFNLGFGSGLAEVTTDDEFKQIVKRFQKQNNLNEKDGQLGDETVAELAKQYGS